MKYFSDGKLHPQHSPSLPPSLPPSPSSESFVGFFMYFYAMNYFSDGKVKPRDLVFAWNVRREGGREGGREGRGVAAK